MTPEERDELRRDLEAAGCPSLAYGTTLQMPDDALQGLRSLLRREVWVVRVNIDLKGFEKSAVFSRHEDAVDWMDQNRIIHCGASLVGHTIDAEVPDGQG